MDLYARRHGDDDDDDKEGLWIQQTRIGEYTDDEASSKNNGYISSSSVSLVGGNFVVDASIDAEHSALEYSEDDVSRSNSPRALPPTFLLLDPMDSDNVSFTSQESDLFLDDAYFQQDFLGKMEHDDVSMEYPPSVSDEGTREGSSVNSAGGDLDVLEGSSDEGIFEDNQDSSFDAPILVPYTDLEPDEVFNGEKGRSFALRLLGKSNADTVRTTGAADKRRKQPNMLKRAVRSFRRRSNRDKPCEINGNDSKDQYVYGSALEKRMLPSFMSSSASVVSLLDEDKILDKMRIEDFGDWGSNEAAAVILTPPRLRSTVDLNFDLETIAIFGMSSDSSIDRAAPVIVSDDDETSVGGAPVFALQDNGSVFESNFIDDSQLSFSDQPLCRSYTSGCIPEGLLSRMSTNDVISQLNLGVDGWSAINCLEQMSSAVSDMCQYELPMLTVHGIEVPDYNAYVKNLVATFRRDLLKSSEGLGS